MIADAAISIIKRHRKPVPLGVLYTEIEASGVDVGTTDPKQYLSTTLNAMIVLDQSEARDGLWLIR